MEHNIADFTTGLQDIELNLPATAAPIGQPKQMGSAPGYTKTSQDKKPASACSLFTIDYWKEYFDVTEEEVVTKVKTCLNPTNSQFEQLIENKVDLYGPFWISTSLIFAMIVVPKLWSVLFFSSVSFDVSKIGFAFTLIYGGLAAFTFVFYGMSKFMGTPAPLFKTAAIYGYGYSIFLLASFACILQLGFLKFIFTMGAGFHSMLFLLRNFRPIIEKLDPSNRLLCMGFFGIMQLFMTLMIYFNYLI